MLTPEQISAAAASLDMAAYTQGLMDLGSGCCTRGKPQCPRCPLATRCFANLNHEQQALPTPKRRAQIPERACSMLILQSDDSVLLEQRPSPGIWGGLWSLPQFDDEDTLRTYCTANGHSIDSSRKMAAMAHTFTHFKLHIEPWHIRCDSRGVAPRAAHQQWFATQDLLALALPAPVKKLLEGLYRPLELSASPADNG